MTFLSLTYFMSGIPYHHFRFALYSFTGLTVSFVAEGLGLAIGAAFSITVSLIEIMSVAKEDLLSL